MNTGKMQNQRIEVRNAQRALEVDAPALRELAQKVLAALGRNKAHLDILITDDAYIRGIKKRYMGIDSATDVISFDTGDIIISAETAKRNAPQFGTTPLKEVCLYLIHGILHLSGYDDATEGGLRRMEKKQEELLDSLCKGTA